MGLINSNTAYKLAPLICGYVGFINLAMLHIPFRPELNLSVQNEMMTTNHSQTADVSGHRTECAGGFPLCLWSEAAFLHHGSKYGSDYFA